ncbi:hypothetical protein K490DRAFT_62296 [Saccharata proteae CBS 121410]|uniref:Uncharacterized protein n=1 Tax=Saccharata proteae CBS 121410 TaxID=1314787 RepID=A0A9P4HXB6_9PEZI|nr:hypothetical protein K490DRAFT_62296 [Saccharata proteae CBS 121410]
MVEDEDEHVPSTQAVFLLGFRSYNDDGTACRDLTTDLPRKPGLPCNYRVHVLGQIAAAAATAAAAAAASSSKQQAASSNNNAFRDGGAGPASPPPACMAVTARSKKHVVF